MLKLSTLIFSMSVLSVSATSIDYRHEFTDAPGNSHKDRLLMSNRFDNGFGISLEGRYKGSDSKKDKSYNDIITNGTEVVGSYLYKLDKKYSIEPGVSFDTGSNYSSIRPYIRGHLKVDSFGWSLRYRPYFKQTFGTANSGEHGYNLTSVLSYKLWKDYIFEYELDYQKANTDGVLLSNNKDSIISHDLKMAYALNNSWSPYVAIGNISGSKFTDDRFTRFRAGVKYSF